MFSKAGRLRVNGLGGETYIVGVLENYPILFGNRVITPMIGIVDSGNFELLMGNDSIEELDMKIHVKNKSCVYSHPQLGD